MKISQETRNLFKIREQSWAVFVRTELSFILLAATYSATIERTHSCVSMAVLSIFISFVIVTYVNQQ